MDRDEDFAAYMATRWPILVRSLVMLGCEHHEAEDVAQTGLVRCYTSWQRVRAADDMDAYVYRTILNAWAKSRRRRWWGEVPTEVLPEAEVGDATDRVLTHQIVRTALARLSADHRKVLVLRYVADLTEPQVAAVLGIAVGTVKSRTARALARVDLADVHEEMS